MTRGGGTRSGDAEGGRAHFFARAGCDGVAPRRVSTSTRSTMGKRIELLFSLLSDGECRCQDDDDRCRRCQRTNVPNVDDAACEDDEDDEDDVVKRRRRSPCNFDLLQAFRYIAVATSSPSPPTSSRLRDDDDDWGIGAASLPSVAPMALGSSPHTDWGTLTVVSS
jgi:hypothetical protein